MVRTVGIAGAAFLLVYAVLSVATGQRLVALGDLAQLIPPLAYAALHLVAGAPEPRPGARVLEPRTPCTASCGRSARRSGPTTICRRGGVPVISPTDPLFFVSSIPLAAALYGRPERDRPRWLFDIVLLDLVLIALFAAFVYIYFVVTIAVTDGREDLYNDNLTQLLNARNLLLALWATWVWRTARSPAWRRMLGVYATGLALTFVGGVVIRRRRYERRVCAGSLVGHRLHGAVRRAAAGRGRSAYDEKLFEPEEEAPALSRLPMVSLIAIALLVAIPVIDEIARRLLDVSPETEIAAHAARAGDDDSVRHRRRGARVPVAARADPGGAGPGDARASSSCSTRSWRRSASWCPASRTS